MKAVTASVKRVAVGSDLSSLWTGRPTFTTGTFVAAALRELAPTWTV